VRIQLGLTLCYSSGGCVSADSTRMPNLTKAFFNWFRLKFPRATASSCTVAFNRLAALHVDKRNVGVSHLTCLDDFSGGGLWVAGERKASVLKLHSHQWHVFDSLWPHAGLPFKGLRCYVSFYTHSAAARACPEVRRRLAKLGVPLPSMAAVTAAMKPKVDHSSRWSAAQSLWLASGFDISRPTGQHMPSSWVCRHCRRFGANAGVGHPRNYCDRNCLQAAYRSRAASSKAVKKRCLKKAGNARRAQ
jgi:hypothetical protein